jgi:hypothetical protein
MNGITEFNYCGVQLRYNPATGECLRELMAGEWKLITPGNKAGIYTHLKICGRNCKLHRLIAEVFLNGGKPLLPTQQIDHIKPADGSHAQDRLSNLRIVSNSQNLMNQRLKSSNKSGYKGVSWNKTANKWQAQITSYGRRRYLGYFTTPEAAALAYDQAAKLLNGEFAKLNFN